MTADSILDFSLVNNIYYTVTYSGSNILLRAINATNVGQQGYICFNFTNANFSVIFTANPGEGVWYVNNSSTSNLQQADSFSVYKYYIFDTVKISLIGERDCFEKT